jgi:hypothetical protein
MKKIILSVSAMLFLTFAQIFSVQSQNVEVMGKVQSDSVSVGSPFTLEISMKAPYGYFVEWADFNKDTLSSQIDIVKVGEVMRTADADSNVLVSQELTLMTFDTGFVQIPSLGLLYSKSLEDKLKMSAYTNPIDLYASTFAVDTTQAYKPIVPPMIQNRTISDYYSWILAFCLLVLATILVWYYLKHRKPKHDENGNKIDRNVIPPYTKAIEDLESLRLQKLWQAGKVKEYYSNLTDIAREYLNGQFNINAVEMTTDDIMREIKPLRFNEQIYAKFKDAMELADLVKFARFSTSPLENDNVMNDMTDFVRESYAHYQDMQAKEVEAKAQAKVMQQNATDEKTEKEVKNV